MTQISDPAAQLSESDRKDRAKVKAARLKAWKRPMIKAERKRVRAERIAQWEAENPGVSWG